jgi:hypothetical protein
MTKLEKILMAVLLVAIAGSIVFWRDLSVLFRGGSEITVDDAQQGKDGKDKKKKDKKDKDKDKEDDDEVRLKLPSNTAVYA